MDLSLIGKTLKDIWFEFPNGKPTWWDSRQPQLRAYNGYGFGEDNDARIIIYFRETTEETYNNKYNFTALQTAFCKNESRQGSENAL